MPNYKGSFWSKWDLHVHTPDSIVSEYSGNWDRFIEDVENLPEEFKVIGINDYIFLDGYKRVVNEHQKGRMQNIDLFLPVIELRVDKFGGSKSKLSRVNYHIVFDSSLSAELIEHQFLAALVRSYQVVPEFKQLSTDNHWQALPTKQSLIDLGEMIINSVPEDQRDNYGTPLSEGFNNLNISLDDINGALNNHYFKGKYLTAVGKTEWADIKWTDQSIAEKKNVINGVDMVFISSDTTGNYLKARKSLTNSSVNDRLLDCSDAHRFSDSADKDRIGKCFTWVKSDATFEGLKQALHDFEHRVKVCESIPVIPPLRIDKTVFNFPDDTMLKGSGIEDKFCYRGWHSINLSPYLTCIIGGRGSGKSTYLNLLHEKSKPGSSLFFKSNKLQSASENFSISDCVDIDATVDLADIEFLSQNSIEEFAMNSKGLTESIFSRLFKLDSRGVLKNQADKSDQFYQNLKLKLESVGVIHDLIEKKNRSENELSANEKLVSSFASDEYKLLNDELSEINEQYQSTLTWKKRLNGLETDVEGLLSKYGFELPEKKNPYSELFLDLLSAIKTLKNEDAVDSVRQKIKLDAIEVEEKLLALRSIKQKELDIYLDSKGFSKENLTDVSNASRRISELKEEIPHYLYQINEVTKKIDERSLSEDPKPAYEQAITDALDPINSRLQNLSAEVKPIKLEYKWNTNSFNEAIIQYLYKSISLLKEKPPRVDRIKLAIESIDFEKVTNKNDLLEYFIDDKQVSKDLHEFFSIVKNYDQFMVAVEVENQNCDKHGAITISYDDRPIQDTSFGQRCTAAIVVLVMLGNTPLIIDEPEAHLDSSLIAKYLVELVKNVKINRQLIFATHNANFVINGDAELIHILEINEEKKATRSSTSIENLDQRHRLLSLEGGIEAFKNREKRYG